MSGVYLIGRTSPRFKPSERPTKLSALRFILHQHFDCKFTIKKSIALAAEEICEIYCSLQIKTIAKDLINRKLKRIHNRYVLLRKCKNRIKNKLKESAFLSVLRNELEVEIQNSSENVQSKKIITNRSNQLTAVSNEDCSSSECNIFSSDCEESDGDDDDDYNDEDYLPAQPRSATQSDNPKISHDFYSTINRYNISARKICASMKKIVESLQKNLSNFKVPWSTSTIQRHRCKAMIVDAAKAKERIFDGPLVLHWDSKLFKEENSQTKVERLAVVVTWNGEEQLLGIPIAPNGSAESHAANVIALLEEWRIERKVAALGFDTTSVNSGIHKGVCQRLDYFERQYIHLACRHHVHEVVLESVFHVAMGKSTGPEIDIFKRFRDQ